MTPAALTSEVVSFGPFRLVPSERLLTKDGAPVELSSRALDILIALLSKPNELISKNDLLARVWPDVTVEEGSLRFHITQLRKALGDGKDGARYITTLTGRGYCFVAPLSRSEGQRETVTAPAGFPHVNLPGRATQMVGRDADILKLSSQLAASRFVTIVGTGGVGKTTVAVAVGYHLLEDFRGAVLFVDLGALNDPGLVAIAVAPMLGLSVQSDDATHRLISHLRDKRILLIFDNCEHLIEAVAALSAQIFAAAPQIHILATSREALQVDNEHVYRMDPLACPPDDPKITASAAQTFPAIQLFVERAAASGARLEFTDAEAATVASICRKLDGVALAIELAARRVESYGLQQTAALLDRRLALLWQGPRTAPARQKTLQATLDWSYGLLSELERAVLRRLAVFVGHFTVDAALAVVADSTVDEAAVFAAIDSLVAKSMLATHPIGAMMRYRLLDTTRAYAVEIADEAERNDLAVRHATYCRGWLEQTGAEWPTFSNAAQREPHLAALNNVRAALDWCFGPNGTVDVGIGLAAAAAPVFLAMSLLAECHRWSERAVLAMNDTNRGGPQEMHLQAALGVALMFTRGNSEAARDALTRSLAIAEDQGDAASELQLLNLLHMFHHRIGDFKATLRYAKRSAHSSKIVGVPAGLALAHCLLGSSLHHLGDLAGARLELEAALERGSGVQRVSTIYLDFEHYNYADIALARTLWLQGHPAQALERAHRSVRDAAAMDHPVPLSRALVWAICVFHWAGDVANADEYTNKLIAHAELHALEPYLAVGRGYKAVFDVCRSDAHTGIACLQNSLEILHAARYELLTTAFQLSLVRGFATIGAFGEGMTLIDEVIRRVETQGEALYAPELLRVKGTLLQSMPEPRIDEAEAQFTRSLALSRRQGARGWELRAAINLAALHARQGRPDSGRAVLHPVFAQFTEGLDTGDLKAAEHLLTTLVRPISKQF